MTPPDLPQEYRPDRDVWLHVFAADDGAESLQWRELGAPGRWHEPVPLDWRACRERVEWAIEEDRGEG